MKPFLFCRKPEPFAAAGSRIPANRWRVTRLPLGGLLLIMIATEGCPLSRHAPYDEKRCDPPCANGTVCYEGQCRSDGSNNLHDQMVRDSDTGSIVIGTWVTITAGTFLMGSPEIDPCHATNETQHQVTLTHDFEIMIHEVTQGQFQSLMGYIPEISYCGSDCPVKNVNWQESVAYCNALSTQMSYAQCYTCKSLSGPDVACSVASVYENENVYSCPGYRLPTEAEFEYAYRADTTSALYNGPVTSCFGDDPNAEVIGWFGSNSGNVEHKVGQKKPNAWGLYDMAGNVGELCHEWYQPDLAQSAVTDPWGPASGDTRIGRGGGWSSPATNLRAASRDKIPAGSRNSTIGFRCVRTLNP